jgi:adhesin transport system outer membrane protein
MRRRPICVALGSLCCFGVMAGLQPVHAQQLTIQRPLLEWASEVQVATPAAVASKPAEAAPMAPAVTRQAAAPVQVASSIPMPAAPVEPVAPTQVSLMPAAAPPAPARTIAATAPVKSTPPAPQPAPVVPVAPALRTAVRETAAPVPAAPAVPAVPTAVTLIPAATPPTPVRIVAAITPAKSTPPALQPVPASALQPAPMASVAPVAARQTMAPINVSQPALPPEPAAPAVPTTVTLIPATAPPTPARTIAATAPAASVPLAPQPAPQPQSAPTASAAPAVARQVMAPVNVSQPVLPPVPEAPPTVAPIPAAAPRAAVAAVRAPLNLAMPRTVSGKGDDFSMRQTAMSAPGRQQSIAGDGGDGGDSSPTAAPKAMPRQVLNTGQIKTADAASARFTQWLAATDDTDAEQMMPRMDEAALRQILYRAVEQASHNSPQVRQAHAEYEAALADIDEAKGQRWPQLNVGTNSKAVSLGGGSANNDTGAGVTVNMTTSVFDWGRNSKTIGSREQLALAARQRYESELDASAFLVSSNVVELAKNRLLVDISQQYVNRMGMLVSMLQEIVSVDRGRGSELTQAKARLLQAESNRDSVAAKVSEFELNLRKLLGDGQIPSLPGRVWPLQPANLNMMLATVNEHPSIKQAEAETEAAELNVGAIKAASRPALNWVVSKSTSRDTLGREQPVQTMLSLNWAAFSGGSQRAQQAAASQRAVASREKKGQQLLDLEYRVRTADQNARTSLARADLYHNLTAETDGVRKAFFEQWYHLAKRTLLDVLSAESDHYNNRVSEINSRFDGYQSIFQEYNGAGQLASWLRGTPSR